MNTVPPLPTVLNQQEQSALLDEPNPCYPIEFRNLVFLRIELHDGLRLPEMCSLSWDQIDLDKGKIYVRGIRVKDRILWMSEDDLALLKKWKRWQEQELKKRMLRQQDTDNQSNLVFTDLTGRPVSKQYLRRMVAVNADLAGLDREVYPHTLRHTFATDLYLKTGNLRLVQKALGFQHLSGARMYKCAAERKLRKAMKNLGHAAVVSDIHSSRGRPKVTSLRQIQAR